MTSAEKISGTSKAKGVLIADSREVAEDILTAYAEKIGLDLTMLTPREWESTVRIACGEQEGEGIETAKGTLDSDRAGTVHKDAAKRRKELFTGQYHDISGSTTNADANSIFDECFNVAVSGENPNISCGSLKRTKVQAARRGWSELGEAAGTDGRIHGFHSYGPTDKAAQGKGNVGDTLDTRTVQANFLVYFGGKKINAHVDVTD